MSLTQRLGLRGDPLWLMDGSAFIFRGFYAYQSMQRSDGFPTNALFIVTRILLRLLREERPTNFCFVLDGKGPTFRHELFPPYKMQRAVTPEPLVQQLDPIKRMVRALGLPLVVSDGCEADDCIASLAARHRSERPVVIVGTDKDLKQCLHDNVVLWDPAAKEEKLVTLKDFTAETGLAPARWPDFQAVIGDSSDNIPGIPGVGPKTAEKIFKDFGSLEEIRDRVGELPEKLRAKFEPHLETMFLYRQLTTLTTDACPEVTLPDLAVRPLDPAEAGAMLREFELRQLTRELSGMIENGSVTSAPRSTSQVQASLFGDEGRRADPVNTCQDPGKLPDCDGVAAAVVPLFDNGAVIAYAVAAGDCESRYSGPVDALARHLSRAAQVAAPDVKHLLRTDPAWGGVDPARWFDLGLAAYLLNPEERDYGWPRLAARWGDELERSSGNPGLLALEMAGALSGRLAGAQLSRLMRTLEMPLIPVLADMEAAGIAVDLDAFAAFLREVQGELDRLTRDVYKAAGGEFNIRSSQQLAELLFGTLGLPTGGKTKGGQTSTAQDVLEKLSGRHPVVDAILEFRKLEKLRSTYLEPLPRLVDGAGRIHTTFNQLATATGRLSSSNPNLQNIPVRGDLGRRMRTCFTAAPGLRLVSADYSQVELRVLAHMSQDPTLLAAFREGADIHSRTASLLYDVAQDQVSTDQRRNAKTINFGLIYGMGPQKLAQELRIPLTEAKAFIERYFSKLQKLREFYDEAETTARELGYVTTMAGRRRLLPEIHSENTQLKSQARRQAINTLIQGSAADIIKLAMLAAHADPDLRALNARLILQVHDELLLEVPADNAPAAGERLAALMSGVRPGGVALDVPLAVDWGRGENWGVAH